MDGVAEHLLAVVSGVPYALAASRVRECYPLPMLDAVVASAAADVVGVANLRGERLAVVCAPGRDPIATPRTSDVIVVAETPRGPVALLVDAVRGLKRLRRGRSLGVMDAAPIELLDPDPLWRPATPLDPPRAAWTPATPEDAIVLQSRARTLAAAPSRAAGARALAIVELAGARYALDLASVRALVEVTDAAPVPCAPAHVRGDVNLRGEVVTLIDARAALGLAAESTAPAWPAKAVLVESGAVRAGLLVDKVLDIAHVEPTAVRPAPAGARHVRGALGDGSALLDLDALLADPALVVEEAPR